MTCRSPFRPASFGKISSPLLFPLSFSRRSTTRRCIAGILDGAQHFASLQRLVPELQRLQLAVLAHRLAVGADARGRHVPGCRILLAVVPARHDEARGEALHVPLPRSGKGLVEVVDGEDDPPLRGGEPPEVGEVRVPAALDVHARRRRGRQVGRHGEGRPAIEGERGADHASVAEREQLGQPPLLGREDHLNRIAASGGRLPLGVRFPGAGLPECLARRVPFLLRQVPGEVVLRALSVARIRRAHVRLLRRSGHRVTPPVRRDVEESTPPARRSTTSATPRGRTSSW